MNREQRRSFKKKYKKGVREHAADRLNELSKELENPLRDGDCVQLNVDRITNRKDYAQRQRNIAHLLSPAVIRCLLSGYIENVRMDFLQLLSWWKSLSGCFGVETWFL